jgi:cation transport ATPase
MGVQPWAFLVGNKKRAARLSEFSFATAMALSSVSVVGNTLRLRTTRP